MEVTNITKISMGEVASLARDGMTEEERTNSWKGLLGAALAGIETELQKHIDEAETVFVAGVELCGVDTVEVSEEYSDDDELEGMVFTFRNHGTMKVAMWRILIRSRSAIKVTSHGYGAVFITYGKE